MYIQVLLMFPLGYGRVKLQKKKKRRRTRVLYSSYPWWISSVKSTLGGLTVRITCRSGQIYYPN